MVTVGFHYSVDFCQLIGNPNVKYRSVKKAAHTMPSVKRALTMLGKSTLYMASLIKIEISASNQVQNGNNAMSPKVTSSQLSKYNGFATMQSAVV